MNKNIIILSEARSGSNVLCELFGNFTRIKNLNEFFLEPGIAANELDLPHAQVLTTLELQTLKNALGVQGQSIIDLASEISNRPAEALSCIRNILQETTIIKVHRTGIERTGLNFIFDTDSKFIFLTRTSKIKQFASYLIAKKIEAWHSVDTSDQRITVDPAEFIAYKNNQLALENLYRDMLLKRNINFLELNYETDIDVEDHSSTIEKIETWLSHNGIITRRQDYSMNFFKKQNETPIEEVILNYQEIKDLV